ncbi:MAG: exodeoxyribonuclease VII large subunit [Thermodesulforhabdaceae bacterium]
MLPYTDPGEDKQFLTVSELTRQIKRLLEGEFAVCWVVGEISNLREPSSGHLYFSLKDSDAQIRAVCFRGSRLALRFKPVDGLEVLCFGRISVYEPRGEYQMIVEYMEPRGIGALKMLFEQLRKKLAAEGLFDPAKKKALPVCPQKVLVITSATGAAIRDILAVLRHAPFPTEITIIPVQVQGDKAPEEIVEAIRMANALQSQNQWDVAIIGRGGGSIEDLWAFNEEEVVRAIAGSKIPTISAVGHEIDVTLSDYAADYRAPTPTAAAKWVVDQQESVKRNLETYVSCLKKAITDLMFRSQQTLDFLRERLKSPERIVEERIDRLRSWRDRIITTMDYRIASTLGHISVLHSRLASVKLIRDVPLMRQQLEHQKSFLLKAVCDVLREYEEKHRRHLLAMDALSPYKVLDRGYAIVTRLSDGKIVKKADDAPVGEMLKIMVAEGMLFCEVRAHGSKE